MELKTTPQNLKKLIEMGMLPSTAKPLFDPLVLCVQKDQVLNKQNHGNILAVYNTFSPTFFETYTPDPEGSYAPIPYLVLGKLKDGFHKPSVELKVDKKSWYLDDGTDHNDSELVSFDVVEFPTPMKKTEYGYLPEKFDPEFAAIIDVSILDLPKMDTYTFDFKAKKFTVSNPKEANFSRKLETVKTLEAKPLHKLVDAEYIQLVTKHLSGEVFIGFQNNLILLTKITKDDKGVELYSQSYLIATMTEGEK
jgi:hypothetical protein